MEEKPKKKRRSKDIRTDDERVKDLLGNADKRSQKRFLSIAKRSARSATAAIKLKCIDCSGWEYLEAKTCQIRDCALWEKSRPLFNRATKEVEE